MIIAAAIVVGACSSAAATPTAAPTAAPTTAPATDTPAAGSPTVAPTAAATFKCTGGSITVAGSTALQPLVDAAAKQYVKDCPNSGAVITVNGGGSGTGLTQVSAGSVNIGDSDVTAESKLQPADAAKLVDHIVARQGWIVVTNKDVTGVTNLTTQQNIDIWTGVDKNWSQVGGPNLPIVLIFRPGHFQEPGPRRRH
jgi:phosphate transport system substrate-binding protein